VLSEHEVPTTTESVELVATYDTVTEVVAVSPTVTAPVAVLTVTAGDVEVIEAFAGPLTPRTPAPNAVTTTSAMRLKYVFVDILFLSLVVREAFSRTAGKGETFAS